MRFINDKGKIYEVKGKQEIDNKKYYNVVELSDDGNPITIEKDGYTYERIDKIEYKNINNRKFIDFHVSDEIKVALLPEIHKWFAEEDQGCTYGELVDQLLKNNLLMTDPYLKWSFGNIPIEELLKIKEIVLENQSKGKDIRDDLGSEEAHQLQDIESDIKYFLLADKCQNDTIKSKASDFGKTINDYLYACPI